MSNYEMVGETPRRRGIGQRLSGPLLRWAKGPGARWVKLIWLLFGGGLALGVGRVVGLMVAGQNMLPATLFGWLFYLGAAAANPFLGLMLWVTSAPYSRFFYLDIRGGTYGVPDGIPDLTLTRVVLLSLLTLVLAQWSTGQRRLARFTLLDWSVLAFAAALFVSVPLYFKGLRGGLVLYTDTYAIPILAYVLAKNLVRTAGQRRFLLGILAFTAAHLAFVAIHEATTGEIWFYYSERSAIYSRSLRRLIGLLGSSAVFGTIFAMLFPFALTASLRTRNIGLKVILFTITGATAAGLFFTYNRASYLGFAWGLLVLIALYPRARRILLPVLAMLVVVVTLQWSELQANPVVAERLSSQAPLEYRSEVLNNVWPLLRKGLWFGRGLDNFQIYYEREALGHLELSPVPYYPHNTFIWVWFSAGLVALIPFVGIYLLILYQAWQLWRHPRPDLGVDRPIAACLIAAWGAYLSQSLVTDVMFAYYATTLFFFLAGAVLGAYGQPAPQPEKQLHGSR